MRSPSPTTPIAPLTLSDGVVAARSWQMGDAPALYEAARESIDTVGPWLPWLDDRYSVADAERWVTDSRQHWARQSEFRFVVHDAITGRLLGGVGLNHLNQTHRFANLGYWVRASATGAGVASRAARLVARFGLTTAGLGRIEILTVPSNLASQHVAAKIGATFEGELRDRLFVRGAHSAARLYSLTRDDIETVLG
jgi:RimJ/RimL family protein N-acetyltransferase